MGKVGWQWAIFAVWANSAAAAWFSMITDAADFCRYSKTRLDMWIGTLSAAVLGQTIAVFLGGYAVAATLGADSNPFDVMAKASGHSVFLLGLILLYVILDNWTINVLNLYTGGLSLCNIVTRIGRFWTTLIVSAIGVGLSVLPQVVNGYVGFMSVMGNLFAPIAGVLIADYIVLKAFQVDVPALFVRHQRYWYWGGFNWVAIVWTGLGFLIGSRIPDTFLNIVATTVITGVLYTVTMLGLKPFVPVIKEAATPARVAFDAVEVDKSLIDGYYA